jgi:hypothetical protein
LQGTSNGAAESIVRLMTAQGVPVPDEMLRNMQAAANAAKNGDAPVGEVPAAGATPVKVASPDEARKLPKGTPIILPDGSPGVVP